MKNSENRAPIRVGLIGVGNWARYGHVPALQRLRSFQITAISSRERARADELASAFSIPHSFTDADELIEHPEVDLVAVLAPAPQHADLSHKAIEAGKDVYCEWPLTTSTEDSRKLLSYVETSSRRHLVGLQRRIVTVISRPRSIQAKQAFYALPCRELKDNCGIGKEDVIVTILSNADEDWSFGLGRPQFLTGDLH